MKAALHQTFGAPEDVMEAAEAPMPAPAAGEVRIKMILSSIHNHDLWTVRGQYGYKPELPAIGGTEAVGLVDEIGEGVDPTLKGQRVSVAGVHGSWAEFFIAPASGLVPLPNQISDEAASQLIAMPFSAISLLDFIDVKAGDWVVQTAANGAVGKIFAQLAQAKGIHVLNLVRRNEAAEELIANGLPHVLSTDDVDWIAKAKRMVGDAGARAAIDSVGGDLAEDLTALLGWEGLLVTFGTATGAPLKLSSGTLITKHITIKGFWGAKVTEMMDPEKRRSLIVELVSLAVQGKLTLDTEAVFPLSEIQNALKAALVPGRKGKVLLRP